MGRKIPKKISKSYLENAALHYLQRYATSAQNLRRVLTRKIERSCRHHGAEVGEFLPLVDDLLRRYAATGLIDDDAYARARAASLRRQGRSRQAIQAKLQEKGLGKTVIAAALEQADADEGNAEFTAALRLARRKKIGAFRPAPLPDAKAAQKEMAVLARAGFSYDVARRALEFSEEDGGE